jgi:hypothetical protein
MLGIAALLSAVLPLAMLPAMAVLVWRLRKRRLRALLALAAMALVAGTVAREFLYAVGLGLPYPGEEGNAFLVGVRMITGAMERYAWQFLAFAAFAAAFLSWPVAGLWRERRGLALLAALVVAGFAVSAWLVWSLTGLRFI